MVGAAAAFGAWQAYIDTFGSPKLIHRVACSTVRGAPSLDPFLPPVSPLLFITTQHHARDDMFAAPPPPSPAA